MLQAKECRRGRWAHQAVYGTAAALLVAALVVSTSIRGAAQQNANAAGVNENSEPTKPTVDMNTSAHDMPRLFQRTPLEMAAFTDGKHGAFIIRMAEILQHPHIRPLTNLLNNGIQFEWNLYFESGEEPKFRFEEIDHIAGLAVVEIKPKHPSEDGDIHGRLMIGSSEVEVRFVREVAWKEWIRKYMPKAEEIVDGDFSYIRLPVIPALGPHQMVVAASDERTIVLANTVEQLKAHVEGPTHDIREDMAEIWRQLDGGLFTIVFGKSGIDAECIPEDDDAARAAKDLVQNTDLFGVAWDMDEHSDRLGIRIRMACESREAAEQVNEATDALVAVFRKELVNPENFTSIGDADPKLSPLAARIYSSLLDDCRKLGVTKNGSGQFEIGLDSAPSLIGDLIAQWKDALEGATVRR